jgi:hypothetical protein
LKAKGLAYDVAKGKIEARREEACEECTEKPAAKSPGAKPTLEALGKDSGLPAGGIDLLIEVNPENAGKEGDCRGERQEQ